MATIPDSAAGPGGMAVEASGVPGAPAIVFIHGLGQSGREWHGHMERLPGYHCLTPDLPGFGRSSHLALPSNARIADLIAELIATRVPSGRASVVGVSWGALLVQVLLQRHPERVDRAVADGLPLVWPRGITLPVLWFITLVTPFLHTRPVRGLLRDVVGPEDLRVASRRAYWQGYVACVRRPAAAVGASAPTLLVAGDREGSVRPTNAALAKLMPHAEARFAPGLGHCWLREAPDLHVRMVEAWVTGQPLPSELRPEPPAPAAVVEQVRRAVMTQAGGTGLRARPGRVS